MDSGNRTRVLQEGSKCLLTARPFLQSPEGATSNENSLKKTINWGASEMAQQVNHLLHRLDNLNLTPGTHRKVGEENNSIMLYSDCHMYTVAYTLIIINTIFNNFFSNLLRKKKTVPSACQSPVESAGWGRPSRTDADVSSSPALLCLPLLLRLFPVRGSGESVRPSKARLAPAVGAGGWLGSLCPAEATPQRVWRVAGGCKVTVFLCHCCLAFRSLPKAFTFIILVGPHSNWMK